MQLLKWVLNHSRLNSCIKNFLACYWLLFHVRAWVCFSLLISFLSRDFTVSQYKTTCIKSGCLIHSWYAWISLSLHLIIFMLCDFFNPNLTQLSISSCFINESIQSYSASLEFVSFCLRIFLFRSIIDAAQPSLIKSVSFWTRIYCEFSAILDTKYFLGPYFGDFLFWIFSKTSLLIC